MYSGGLTFSHWLYYDYLCCNTSMILGDFVVIAFCTFFWFFGAEVVAGSTCVVLSGTHVMSFLMQDFLDYFYSCMWIILNF